MKKEIKKVEESKKTVNKTNRKKALIYTKLILYITMLILVYILSPRLTELLKQGLQAIINTPSENITRVITIILAVILSAIVLRNKKKGE